MKRLKSYGLCTFLILALFISTTRHVFASNPNNQDFIQIRFKTSKYKNKTKNKVNRQDSASVVIVNSDATGNVAANAPLKTPKLSKNNITDKPKNSKENSKRILVKPDQKSTDSGDPGANEGLIKSGLLAKSDSLKNYKKNLSHIFPMIINKEIVHYIHYYQTAGRKFFKYALARSERYIPMIKKVFNKLGIPNDLAYLAMIESGFSPTAYSYAGASGMWQFIPSTGRLFGLTTNWWVDERRNPVESTYAAGRYLKDLFNKFGSWYLAAAAYNSGELTIERALSLYPGGNFWTISQNRPYLLPGQTRRYVPKIIAAAIIAKDPENFGFHNIIYRKPIKFKQVNVPFSVSLYALAKCAGISEYTLWHMNQDLLRNATPPNDPGFMLNIPASKYKIFIKNFKHIQRYINQEPQVVNTSYERPENNVYYTIQPGDTLMGIASKYGISLGTLERYNGLNNYSVLRVGERITIPGINSSPTIHRHIANSVYYTIQPGDTLMGIASKYGISLGTLERYNGLNNYSVLRVGERITIPGINSSPTIHRHIANSVYYTIQPGDTLMGIASKYGISLGTLERYNGLNNYSVLRVGERITIPGISHAKAVPVNLQLAYVVVKPGMTLWSISHNYNVPLNTIRLINHIAGNDIHVGEKIFIKRKGFNSRYSYIHNNHPRAKQGFLHYRVKFGDSLYSIALKFHDNINNIMADNNIKNPNAIYPGEILKINQ